MNYVLTVVLPMVFASKLQGFIHSVSPPGSPHAYSSLLKSYTTTKIQLCAATFTDSSLITPNG